MVFKKAYTDGKNAKNEGNLNYICPQWYVHMFNQVLLTSVKFWVTDYTN